MAGPVRRCPAASRARVLASLAWMQRSLEPVRLLGVDPAEPRRAPRAARPGPWRGSADRSSETGAQPAGHRQLVDQARPATASAGRMPCSCWSSSTSRVTAGVTYGLPSRSPPIQVPKVSGRAVGGSRHAELAQRRRPGRRAPAGRRRRARSAQVVDGVAGLVARVGPVQAQLVGLPQQVDQLGQPALGRAVASARAVQAVAARPRRRARRRRARSLVRIERRAASVGWAVKTGRTASRPAAAAISAAGTPRSRDQLGGPVQPAAVAGRGARRSSRARCTCSVMLARWK